jgi:diguanylate cyclase (GGDEF)-like protein/PAS domain S-box-containing protein
MENNAFNLSTEDSLHIFMTATDSANVGMAIMDCDGKVWFWNRWLEEKSGLSSQSAVGKVFLEMFPDLARSRLASAMEAALKHGLTSMLSHSLNKHPLPLFENLNERDERMRQAIHVTPVECKNRLRFCLIQVNDVSASIRKELLLREQAEKLHGLAYLDGLTGIPNRRRLDEYLSDEFKRASRSNAPLSVIMVDIDHFKQYNDTYGHQTGDFCLQRIANAIKASLHRPADLAARYGGEEFAVVLPDTPLNGAVSLAEDISKHVESLAIPHESSKTAEHVTLSMGIACISPDPHASGDNLLKQADAALYQAKKDGRNRIRIFKPAQN